ncbi:MAG: uroporphyrinogen-III synthase [Pseudomonadota bacterium]
MRVIVTRPANEAADWVDALRARGFDAIAFPLIEIGPVDDPAPLRRAWDELEATCAVMFVSGNAVRHFFAQRPKGAQWPAVTRAWATGAGTHDALKTAGIAPTLIDSPSAESPQFDSEALWERVSTQVRNGDVVVIVRGADAGGEAAGRDWLAGQLSSAGAVVRTVAAYVRRAPARDRELHLAAPTTTSDGVWLFSSSQAIHNLLALDPKADWSATRAVATHPRIAESARSAGFGVVCESRPGLDAVIAALESFR